MPHVAEKQGARASVRPLLWRYITFWGSASWQAKLLGVLFSDYIFD